MKTRFCEKCHKMYKVTQVPILVGYTHALWVIYNRQWNTMEWANDLRKDGELKGIPKNSSIVCPECGEKYNALYYVYVEFTDGREPEYQGNEVKPQYEY